MARLATARREEALRSARNTHGEARFLLSSEECYNQVEMASCLSRLDEFASFPIPTEAEGPPLQDLRYSNKRAREVLGIDFIPLETSMVEGALSLFEHGIL